MFSFKIQFSIQLKYKSKKVVYMFGAVSRKDLENIDKYFQQLIDFFII